MAILIETRLNSLTLNESTKPRKGCLGRLEGICADFKNPTRNDRLYPLKLWENVFNDPIFQESLKAKTLIGELDHPEDRLEVLAGEACIVMTDYLIDYDEGVIRAGFDILDTPRGKVLKSLLDYGCVLGVSSRGQGDISNSDGIEVVDADTYDFACFDVVITPAVAKARQNVVESVTKTKRFVESMKSQIEDAETIGDLKAIERVVKSTQSSDIGSLLESIQHKCSSITEGKTITSDNNEVQPGIETNINSKSDSSDDNDDTGKNGDSENNSSAKTIREYKELLSCINSLRKQVSSYKHRESRLVDVVNAKNSQLESLKLQLKRCKKEALGKDLLRSKNESLTEKIQSMSNQLESSRDDATTRISKLNNQLFKAKEELATLKESVVSKDSEIKDLKKTSKDKDKILLDVKQKYTSANETIRDLKKSLKSRDTTIKDCNETIESLESQISVIQSELNTLKSDNMTTKYESEKNIDEMEAEINQYSELVDALQSQVTNLKQQKDESVSKSKQLHIKCEQLSKKLSTYQQNYINIKCRQFGIDSVAIKENINSEMSVNQIDKLIEGVQKTKDRYAKLPISENTPLGIVLDNNDITPRDTEIERLSSFIENVTKAT